MLQNKSLAQKAARVRLLGLEMVHRASSGHIGGALSAVEILTILYDEIMQIDPKNPRDPIRDRFVLSKGHATPALYPLLAFRGYFPESDLTLFRSIDGQLSGHAEMHLVPGVDMSTGSLGQGISAAVGMAIAGKLDRADYRVYTLLGDGELNEGQVWEALASANKYKLDNLCAIVDINGLQIDGTTEDVMPMQPIDAKFAAFGWHVISVDGHDFDALRAAFEIAKSTAGCPTVLLAQTVKGKCVSFMEHVADWHGVAPNDEQYARAHAEVAAIAQGLEG